MMQLAFLGTGSSSSTIKNPSSFALSNGFEMFLIDSGGGSYHQISRLRNKGFSPDITKNIFLTHFHMDHVSGLPDFIWGETWNSRGQRTMPLNIIGPTGLRDFWDTRFTPFFGREIPFIINLYELSDGDIFYTDAFQVKSVKLNHNENSTGYLFIDSKISIAFTGDTGWCDPLINLVNSADITICEWSFTEKSPSESHMGGDEIIALLEKTSARSSIYFTHIFPETGKTYADLIKLRREKVLHLDRKIYFPEDLFILNIERTV